MQSSQSICEPKNFFKRKIKFEIAALNAFLHLVGQQNRWDLSL
jgi:hypothetical protein